MVPHLGGVIEDRGLLCHARCGGGDLFQGHVGVLRAWEQLEEVVDIGLVMRAIVKGDSVDVLTGSRALSA